MQLGKFPTNCLDVRQKTQKFEERETRRNFRTCWTPCLIFSKTCMEKLPHRKSRRFSRIHSCIPKALVEQISEGIESYKIPMLELIWIEGIL
jgi:hypothetical protein